MLVSVVVGVNVGVDIGVDIGVVDIDGVVVVVADVAVAADNDDVLV